MSDARAALVRECRKIHRDSLYCATGHFEAADAHRSLHVPLRVAIVLLGAAGALGATKITGFSEAARLVIAGVASAAASVMGGMLAVLKSEEAQAAHGVAGKQFKSLQHDARRAHAIFGATEELTAFQSRAEALMQRYNELNESAPVIPNSAYERAKRRIESGEFEGVPAAE